MTDLKYQTRLSAEIPTFTVQCVSTEMGEVFRKEGIEKDTHWIAQSFLQAGLAYLHVFRSQFGFEMKKIGICLSNKFRYERIFLTVMQCDSNVCKHF